LSFRFFKADEMKAAAGVIATIMLGLGSIRVIPAESRHCHPQT
jgi:hypothetical protein